MAAKRAFLLLGSGEFEPWTHEVEAKALARAGGDGTVLVVPTASSREGDKVFNRWARMGLDHYADAGVPAELMPIKTRDDAKRDEHAERFERASMIYFSGGKPAHLASVFDGTPSWNAICRAIERGAVHAGCSAGAMVASQSREQRRLRGDVGVSFVFGMGLVPHMSFGVHWNKAQRIPGLRMFVHARLPNETWFAGIEERTAILGDGQMWDVHGLQGVDVRSPDGARRRYEAGERFTIEATTVA
jgi:cyanophycinase